MTSRKERAQRAREFPNVCMNCGEKGPHFVPPGFGSGGFFMCKSKEEKENEESMIEVQRYRKKPVSVEVVQWAGNTTWKDLREFANYLVRSEGKASFNQGPFFVYDRLHDTWVEFTFDDWIIKGIQGEFYPVKDDIFRQCYELEGTTYHGREIG